MEQVRDYRTELETERLLLRPYKLSDAPRVTELCNNHNVSRMTTNIPYPYELKDAEKFITQVTETERQGNSATFAVILKNESNLIGSIGSHARIAGEYELGYWLGEPYWGEGYATEATIAVVEYICSQKQPTRIYAGHDKENPASKRVLEKAGFVSTCKVEVRSGTARGKDMHCHMLELPL